MKHLNRIVFLISALLLFGCNKDSTSTSWEPIPSEHQTQYGYIKLGPVVDGKLSTTAFEIEVTEAEQRTSTDDIIVKYDPLTQTINAKNMVGARNFEIVFMHDSSMIDVEICDEKLLYQIPTQSNCLFKVKRTQKTLNNIQLVSFSAWDANHQGIDVVVK